MTLTTPPPIDPEEEEMLVLHSEFVAAEGSEPVEETANSVDAPKVDDPPKVDDRPSERFTWTIENFSKLTRKKVYSDVFLVGGYKWRVLIFPKGNNSDHLSVYLDVADFATLPYGWSKNIQLSLAVVNQVNSDFTIRKDTQHRFNARTKDWGFTSFMPLSDLYDPSKGYLLNDTFMVEADVAVVDPPTTRFTWTIENFSRLTDKMLWSDVFFVGGCKWRVLIYPKGNNTDHLSLYLDAADSITLPDGWNRHAQFSLAMVNQIHSESTIRKDTEHRFYAHESDWGFTSFMPLSDLYDPGKGYLLNDTCIVEADVAVLEVDVKDSIPNLDGLSI
ncbi:putative ubiquitinyl hydrolase 1 [Helianthus debilis subsp. tardiflorus]